MDFHLDYDQWIHLDAENLAECGIAEAYESLLPQLRHYVAQPISIEEDIDNNAPRYAVRWAGKEFVVWDPTSSPADIWGRAMYILFFIVNDQLAGSESAVAAGDANSYGKVREYWLQRGEEAEGEGHYDRAYWFYYRAGWDLFFTNDMKLILERLQRAANAAGWRPLARLAEHHRHQART
jgi:hypothetical protein